MHYYLDVPKSVKEIFILSKLQQLKYWQKWIKEAIFLWLAVQYKSNLKFFFVPRKRTITRLHLIMKILWFPFIQSEHCALRLKDYLWVTEFPQRACGHQDPAWFNSQMRSLISRFFFFFLTTQNSLFGFCLDKQCPDKQGRCLSGETITLQLDLTCLACRSSIK